MNLSFLPWVAAYLCLGLAGYFVFRRTRSALLAVAPLFCFWILVLFRFVLDTPVGDSWGFVELLDPNVSSEFMFYASGGHVAAMQNILLYPVLNYISSDFRMINGVQLVILTLSAALLMRLLSLSKVLHLHRLTVFLLGSFPLWPIHAVLIIENRLVAHVAGVAFSLVGFYFLVPRSKQIAPFLMGVAAGVSGGLATLSSAWGLVFWPIAVFVLGMRIWVERCQKPALRSHILRAMGLIATMVPSLALYLKNFASGYGAGQTILPWQSVGWAIYDTFLSMGNLLIPSSMTPIPHLFAMLLGVITVVAGIYYLCVAIKQRSFFALLNDPLIWLIGFGLGGSLLAGLGRAAWYRHAPLGMRYTEISHLVPLGVLGLVLATRVGMSRATVLVLLGLSIVTGSWHLDRIAKNHRGSTESSMNCFATEPSFRCFDGTYPDLNQKGPRQGLLNYLNFMSEHRVSFLRHEFWRNQLEQAKSQGRLDP